MRKRKKIVDSIKEVYKYSLAGSGLHIVLDDFNVERDDIKWCIKHSIPQIENESERKACERCAKLLLKVSKRKRRVIISSTFIF